MAPSVQENVVYSADTNALVRDHTHIQGGKRKMSNSAHLTMVTDRLTGSQQLCKQMSSVFQAARSMLVP